jgi:hypothetical protein
MVLMASDESAPVGGICWPKSLLLTRRYTRLVELLPGRMRLPETAARRSSRRPAICCSGP